MDGFTGFKTATTEELPDAVAVMDPFHVVRLAGDALDRCRRRVQQTIHGHRGRTDDPLYRARRTLHTGADLLTDKQTRPARRPVRRRRPRRGRGHLGHLPAHDRRLPRTRPGQRPRADGQADRRPLSQRRPDALTEVITLGPDAEEARRRRARLLRPARHQQRPDRGDQRTTRTPPRLRPRVPQPHQLHRPIAYSRPAASDPDYTLDCEEPDMPEVVKTDLVREGCQ